MPVIVLISLLAMLLPISFATADDIVTFPDPNLEAAIRDAIAKPTGDIYQSDLDGLTYLDALESDITDLAGLEHCTDLIELDLWDNQIGNISPLSTLSSLIWLDLGSNQISDISPLSSLTSPTWLYLDQNQIGNISPLSSLTSLEELGLSSNQISDVSSLSSLTSLTELDLWENQIGNISPLSSLTSLIRLDLGRNQISDISPLSSLSSLTWLHLGGNQIGDISPLSALTSLEGLGLLGNQISDISPLSGLTSLMWLRMDDNQMSDISPLSGLTSLEYLNLVSNLISDISPLSGLTNLTWLYLNANQISDIIPLVDNPGLSDGDHIDLSCNPLSVESLNTYIPQLEDRGVAVTNEIYELNPQLQAEKTLAAIYEVVTFQNLTTCGTNPYTMAEWDFEADGVVDLTLTGPHAQVTANVTWAYSTPGIYDVILRMTDSTAATSSMERHEYIMVVEGIPVIGVTREVNCATLPGVGIALDGIGPVLSDIDGNYTIMAPGPGDYTITATKEGFREESGAIDVDPPGPVTFNFQGEYGLIPNAPDIWYALDCVNLWLYPPPSVCGLDIWTALEVVNAWLYPVTE